MIKDNAIVDTGWDKNLDTHCDIDGWFVDKGGNHFPAYRVNNGREEIQEAFAPKYTRRQILDSSTREYRRRKYTDALRVYSKNDKNDPLSSPNINSVSRGFSLGTPDVYRRIYLLDEAINNSVLTKPLRVYRGISADENSDALKDILSAAATGRYLDMGFMSVSYSIGHATSFAFKGDKNPIFLQIELPKGAKCLPIIEKNEKGSGEEWEMLLPRFSRFSVKKHVVEKSKDGRLFVFAILELVL